VSYFQLLIYFVCSTVLVSEISKSLQSVFFITFYTTSQLLCDWDGNLCHLQTLCGVKNVLSELNKMLQWKVRSLKARSELCIGLCCVCTSESFPSGAQNKRGVYLTESNRQIY